ncbi:unnamed protein product [Ostreobium quekettii]|uniref:Uncharacterized protein n=1 Tax=Ostreobium quekettii TaxID=121088 RepID=A0A8S1IQT9_9CHLO|nr:unnamed protein product [Ostreobium quekettii]
MGRKAPHVSSEQRHVCCPFGHAIQQSGSHGSNLPKLSLFGSSRLSAFGIWRQSFSSSMTVTCCSRKRRPMQNPLFAHLRLLRFSECVAEPALLRPMDDAAPPRGLKATLL